MLVPLLLLLASAVPAQTLYNQFGPSSGKHIVLISGDEEYRSEETLTQLARILAARHNFRCTVLYAIDPNTGIINPHATANIPGLEMLDRADLMIIFTRWRRMPDDRLAIFDRYLKSGKPVIGLRTATHAFAPTRAPWGPFSHYSDGYAGPIAEWRDGFGRVVLGEKWVAHHGRHKHESTAGVLNEKAAGHPILRGLANGTIWGPSDVYTVRLPLPGDSLPLVFGQVVERAGSYDESDANYGMRPTDAVPVAAKNSPMMPIAWTKSYQIPGGKKGRVFTTTMGASTDVANAGLRRLLVNGVYWALGKEKSIPAAGAGASVVGKFEPTRYNNHGPEWWEKRGLRPADLIRD
jgi:hypothetical protein